MIQRQPAAVQGEIRARDPGLPAQDIRTGTEVIDQALCATKIGVGLLGVFGRLALSLASVGWYGIVAYSANQRLQLPARVEALLSTRAENFTVCLASSKIAK